MEQPSSARTLKNQNKKIFLIASENEERIGLLSRWVTQKFEDSVIYTASDSTECFQKIENAPPTALITDFIISRSKSVQTLENLIKDEAYAQLPLIVIGSEILKSEYMDEVVTGKLQFIDHLNSEMDFYPLLNRAMNFATSLNPSNYQMKYLSPGETLIREGESSDHVFILKKGMLMASKTENNKEVILGPIHPGEFVGEMGFLNNTKRVATVKAVQESQVVSIPVEIFDTVIFKRPSWAKLILTTISKRLSTTLKKQEPKAE